MHFNTEVRVKKGNIYKLSVCKTSQIIRHFNTKDIVSSTRIIFYTLGNVTKIFRNFLRIQ